jgi:hypothetical protein
MSSLVPFIDIFLMLIYTFLDLNFMLYHFSSNTGTDIRFLHIFGIYKTLYNTRIDQLIENLHLPSPKT